MQEGEAWYHQDQEKLTISNNTINRNRQRLVTDWSESQYTGMIPPCRCLWENPTETQQQQIKSTHIHTSSADFHRELCYRHSLHWSNLTVSSAHERNTCILSIAREPWGVVESVIVREKQLRGDRVHSYLSAACVAKRRQSKERFVWWQRDLQHFTSCIQVSEDFFQTLRLHTQTSANGYDHTCIQIFSWGIYQQRTKMATKTAHTSQWVENTAAV